MIFSRMLHPVILPVVEWAGHGSRFLIADGNDPVSTHSRVRAAKVFLKLRRGRVRIADVLEASLLITIGVVKKDQP
jgi:L-fucose mutarotase